MEDVRGNRAEKSGAPNTPPRQHPKTSRRMPRNFQRRVQIVSKICTLVFFLALREPSLLSAPERAAESPALFAGRGAFVLQDWVSYNSARPFDTERAKKKNLRQTETIGSGLGGRRGTATGAAGRRLVRPVEPVDRAPGSVAGARVDPRSGSAIGARVADEGPRKKRPGALEGVSRR